MTQDIFDTLNVTGSGFFLAWAFSGLLSFICWSFFHKCEDILLRETVLLRKKIVREFLNHY